MKRNISLSIGLYLQTTGYRNKRSFDKAMKAVKESDIDILVFPEFSYVPFEKEIKNKDICTEDGLNTVYDYCVDFSKELGKAVVINIKDGYGTIYSIYANAFADETETEADIYVKHTMTEYSAFQMEHYKSIAKEMFQPIIYKGIKIGLTICYDCNHAIFSRMYGLNEVDVILNSTGGDVVYDKWYKYNKARAIENECFNFVAMGGIGAGDSPYSYVYGFNPQGGEMKFRNLMLNTEENNVLGTIYVYNTADDNGLPSIETSIDQTPKINKNQHFSMPVGKADELLKKSVKIAENIFRYKHGNDNIVFMKVHGIDILKPEKVLRLLYADELKNISNKKYIIVNQHEYIDEEFFKNKLSLILKVRAMENFCAVVLESDNINNCYQCGNNRTAQVVMPSGGVYGIDLQRTAGPEAIWKNKQGMKADWRENAEWLINQM